MSFLLGEKLKGVYFMLMSSSFEKISDYTDGYVEHASCKACW